jgi:hypothetical protein
VTVVADVTLIVVLIYDRLQYPIENFILFYIEEELY